MYTFSFNVESRWLSKDSLLPMWLHKLFYLMFKTNLIQNPLGCLYSGGLYLFCWTAYFGGLSLFWWAMLVLVDFICWWVICILVGCLYSDGLSLFCWAAFILMICHYSPELSTEIVDYFCHLLQILCSHFA